MALRSVLGDGHGVLGAVVHRELRCVLPTGGDDTVALGRCHPEVVDLEEIGRENRAPVVTLALLLIDVDTHVGAC